MSAMERQMNAELLINQHNPHQKPNKHSTPTCKYASNGAHEFQTQIFRMPADSCERAICPPVCQTKFTISDAYLKSCVLIYKHRYVRCPAGG